ncbi:MAG: ferrous iron transport protein A [Clostridia bacterium]|nr:ferrous iron transport protein A [Clostridia bacterium]
MSVFDLSVGECAYIKNCNLTGSASARLNSLGIVAGKKITVLAFSLFKSSVLIGCGVVRLGLRKSLAKCIEVEKCA